MSEATDVFVPKSNTTMDMSAVMNLVASRQPEAQTSLGPALQRQKSLAPIRMAGHDFLEIRSLATNASSFTTVHLVATERDNTQLDSFAHGKRTLRVLKRIHIGSDESIAEAAERELAIYEKLNLSSGASSRVVKLINSEWQRERTSLVLMMEYAGGGTLEGWMPEDAPELLSTCTVMLRCLSWLHDQGVVHLDVKPANFVFCGGRLKLIDFGVARLIPPGKALQLSEPFPGSIDFLPLEAIHSAKRPVDLSAGDLVQSVKRIAIESPYEVSAMTDIWAFGCVVCKIVTGATPFPPCEDRAELKKQCAVLANLQEHRMAVHQRMAAVREPGVGAIAAQLVFECLRTRPEDRPTAAELLRSPLFISPLLEAGPPPVEPPARTRAMPKLAREASITTADKLSDLLFHVFCFVRSPKALFAARRVCKAWRARIDGTSSTSPEWHMLLEACLATSKSSAGLEYHLGFDWKSLLMMNATVATDLQVATSGEEKVPISAERLARVLQQFRSAGETTALAGVSFKVVLSMRLNTKAALHAFIYSACTQKPPANASEMVYNWWACTVPEMRQALQAQLLATHASDEQLKRKACESFGSFTKLMANALAYLDRFYIERLSLPPLSEIADTEKKALRRALGVGEE